MLCVSNISGVIASDCTGEGCFTETLSVATVTTPARAVRYEKPAPLPEAQCNSCGQYGAAMVLESAPMQPIYVPATSLNVVSVKPVVADGLPPVWDGNHAERVNYPYDKTVDWRDGVPIWDDSISHYKDKNFDDWFLNPQEIVYVDYAQPALPIQAPVAVQSDAAEIAEIRKQVEDLLIPLKPMSNLWTNKDEPESEPELACEPLYEEQDLSAVVTTVFKPDVENVKILESDDGCPFETESDCAIWRRKPMVRETVSPRSPKIRNDKMGAFIAAANANNRISANTPVAAPLLARYKMLMQSAQACCADGMVHQLKRAGASDGLVYKFMADDANFYGLGARCLMMSDADFDQKFPNTATAAVAADVRNGCLCRGRQWFHAMLAPFEEAYKAVPTFADEKFNYTYIDGLQREVTVSVNNDVKNVLNQLALCP